MPAVRKLAEDIAVNLGKSKFEGWAVTDYMLRCGLVAKGRGGRSGAGAPQANSSHGIIALLALSTGSPPKQAVKEAQILYGLRLVRAECQFFSIGGALTEPLSIDEARKSATFGEFLSLVIDGYRMGFRQPETIARGWIEFGVRAGLVIGTQSVTYAGVNQLGQTVAETWTYGGVPRSDITEITADRIVTLPLSALWRLGDLLGPLPAGSSGGGEPRKAPGEEDAPDLHSDELPMAAAPVARGGETQFPEGASA